MAVLGSEAWFDDLAARLAPAALEEPLTVRVEIHGPRVPLSYRVRFGPSGASVARGSEAATGDHASDDSSDDAGDDADVTFVLDAEGAEALRGGRTSARALLLGGRLKVRGAPGLLRERASALEVLRGTGDPTMRAR